MRKSSRTRQKLKLAKGPKFTDRDIWEMGFVLARICAKGIKQFRLYDRYGYPSHLTEEQWENELKEMEWALSEVANNYPSDPWNLGFDKWLKDNPSGLDNVVKEEGKWKTLNFSNCYCADESTKKAQEEYYKRIEKSLHLFIDRLGDMWD